MSRSPTDVFIVGHPVWRGDPYFRQHKVSGIFQRAAYRRQFPTAAEARLAQIFDELKPGKPELHYQREWVLVGRYIIDFFFDSVRLAIEVDGQSHDDPAQKSIDREKARAMFRENITLVRISNADVFGQRDRLLAKLRVAWQAAKKGERGPVCT